MTNVVYRYLGYGTTDSTGTAKLDHDANGDAIEHSYTGMGIGEVDVVASLDNPIIDGSIVSETFSVIDALVYPTATTDFNQNGGTISLSDGVFTKGETGNSRVINPSDSSINWASEITVEFDVVTASTLAIQMRESSNGFSQRVSNIGGTDGSHVKIVYDGSYITPYVDGVEKTSYKVAFTHTTNFQINLANVGSFKNLVVY